MSRRSKSVCAGLGVGLLGLVVSVTPFGIALEENIGLHLLFKLRGARQAPPDVLVVATESASENQLNLPSSLTKWPRSLHARLIDNIVDKNAAVIAFDIFFGEERSPQDGDGFAKAIQRAGNIVLVEELKKDLRFNSSGTKIGHVEIEKIVSPIPLLGQPALASAPFPLPKTPGHMALDIIQAVDAFNRSCSSSPLPTRIGIHSGYISLGYIGAFDHYQYQPVGDSVNTASRIEGLNKHLGTQILVSEEVLEQLDDFLVRGLGQFILAGKSTPVKVYELICRMEDSTELQKSRCNIFMQALDAYQRQSLNEAIDGFNESVRIHPEDGPSLFYLDRCEKYKRNPPGDTWDGVVRLPTK